MTVKSSVVTVNATATKIIDSSPNVLSRERQPAGCGIQTLATDVKFGGPDLTWANGFLWTAAMGPFWWDRLGNEDLYAIVQSGSTTVQVIERRAYIPEA